MQNIGIAMIKLLFCIKNMFISYKFQIIVRDSFKLV